MEHLPDGWDYSTLQEVAPVIDCKHKTPTYVENGVPIVSPGNISWGPLQLEGCRQVAQEDYAEMMNHCTVQAGDVVFGRNQSVGISSIVTDERPFALGQDTVLIQPTSIDPSFLHHWLRSNQFSRSIWRLQGGSTFGRINLKDLRKLPVAQPPPLEAQSIAEILSTWDQAIETAKTLLANAQRQKKALMQQLLTGQKRVPGFTGDWIPFRLDGLVKVSMGSSPPSDAYNNEGNGLPLIQGNADIEKRTTAPRFHTSEITKTCAPGDAILSVRAPVGEIAVSHHLACLGRGVAGLRAKSESDKLFIYYLLLDAERRWVRYSQGSTFKAVNSNDVKGFRFTAPRSIDEREQIGKILDEAEQSEKKLISQLAAFQQEKSALMQQLLTGKRRVKVDESENA